MPPEYDYCEFVDPYEYEDYYPHGSNPCTDLHYYDDIFYHPGMDVQSTIIDMIPGIKKMDVNCPATACVREALTDTLLNQIIHLNDTHQWTREQIADWLETLDFDLTIRKSA